VSAKDKATGKEQSMTITGQSSLAKEDINRMVRDAESHAEEDRRRREEAEVRNQADSLVYQTEKMLKEQAASFSGDQKSTVESELARLKEKLGGTDNEAIKSATEKLAVSVQELGKQLYEQASASSAATGTEGPSGGTSSSAPNDDEVVDAEIVDEGHNQ
jgi:molecular chaperone DnaK